MNVEELKTNISHARLDVVFKELTIFLKGQELEFNFNMIKADWSALKKNDMILSTSEKDLARNKINFKLLNLLDEINKLDSETIKPIEEKIRILFLSANPADTSKLQLDTEFVEINKLIQASPEKDKFELYLDTNITPNKLHDAIQKYRPHIFHFSGHGFGTGELKETEGDRSIEKPPALSGLIIEDEKGNRKTLAGSALDGLFELLASEANVQAVILNACYSAEQAKIIKKHVKNVIGMTDAIGDKSAITFASGFYRAISNGKDIERAFKYGKNLMALEGYNEEHKVILV